jgi:hypothetical protein
MHTDYRRCKALLNGMHKRIVSLGEIEYSHLLVYVFLIFLYIKWRNIDVFSHLLLYVHIFCERIEVNEKVYKWLRKALGAHTPCSEWWGKTPDSHLLIYVFLIFFILNRSNRAAFSHLLLYVHIFEDV